VPGLQPDPLLRAARPRDRPRALTRSPSTPADTLHIHIDGASRGNPGEAAFGVYVTTPAGDPVAELYGYLGRASNNVAEYQALIHALKYALARGAARVNVFSDSELVVRQISGQYRVKHPDMLPLYREAKSLLLRLGQASLSHVRREQNKDADRLANQALDEKASKLE
jgi:ribonuclease HI